jgi:hypothetical protein
MTAGIFTCSDAVADEQVRTLAAVYGFTLDEMTYAGGVVPDLIDAHVATVAELENYLATVDDPS